jgi:aryl-alcohol dehydrogenase-like predicted oxidoreductase
MQYRKLGRGGPSVSAVGFGTWQHVTPDDQPKATALVRAALDTGINLIDTADVYGDGAALTALGVALRGVPRDAYVLASKVFYPTGPGEHDRGLGREHVTASVEDSLRRARTDYLDILQAHRFDPDTPLEETLSTIGDLIRSGKVLHYGFSEWTAEQIRRAAAMAREFGMPAPVSNQPQYSILWRVPERTVFPASAAVGMGQLVFWPLAQGVLTGKYGPGGEPPEGSRAARESERARMDNFLHDAILERVDLLRRVATQRGWTAAQLAVAWVLNRPHVTAAIVGASRPEQLAETAAAADLELDARTLELVDKVFAGCYHEEADGE